MARKFTLKQRNSNRKAPKPLILLIAEGRNVTETLYFRQFQVQHAAYNIKIITPGSITDPKGTLEKLEMFWEKNEMDADRGDLGFVVLDLDCDSNKGKLIEKLQAGSQIAQFVVSNPCFEVWFLLHYKYTTHVYSSGTEVIHDLRNFIHSYEKNQDVSGMLKEKMDTALQNAEQLVKHFDELDSKWPSNDCNPRTDVPLIINAVRKQGGDKKDCDR